MPARICIVGTGYVGMACVIGLAQLGNEVRGYDVQADRIERLRAGVAPYREQGLEAALKRELAAGRVHFFDDLQEAAGCSDVIIIAVGTPSRDDGSCDLSAMHAAIAALGNVSFKKRPTVVIRSTVPPGSSDMLAPAIEPYGDVIYAPEFLREGSAIFDFLNPDRIVVGSATPAAALPYVRLLEALHKPVLFTTLINAELIKCCSNAFLALKISFANEVANLCDAVHAGVDDVLRGIGYDKRIGSAFLNPGIGFGGPCFEKDVKSIHHVAGMHESGRELFSATLRVNERQPQRIVETLEDELGDLAGRVIGVWGLAFKNGTDDTRDSLAIRIVHELARRGASIVAYDPAVQAAALPANCRMASSALEAAVADALLVLTEWPQFAQVNPSDYAGTIRSGVVVDGRNILDADRVQAAGLWYRGVGRRSVPVLSSAIEHRAAKAVAS